jgi:hypothetical protein
MTRRANKIGTAYAAGRVVRVSVPAEGGTGEVSDVGSATAA